MFEVASFFVRIDDVRLLCAHYDNYGCVGSFRLN